MIPPKKNPLPFDPAWLALGLAALVLIGTAVWLIAVRTAPVAVAPAPQVAAAPPAPAPDPVAERLAAAEARLAQLAARPPENAGAVVDERIAALGPSLEARLGQALEARFGQVEGRLDALDRGGAEVAARLQAEVAAQRGALEQVVLQIQAGAQRAGAELGQALRTQAQQFEQALQGQRAAIEAVQRQLVASDAQRAATEQAQRGFGEQVATRIAAIEQAGQQQQAALEALQRVVVAIAEQARQQQAAIAEQARQQQAAIAEQARQQQAAEQARQQQAAAAEQALRAAAEQAQQRLEAQREAMERALREATEGLAQRIVPLEQGAQRLAQAQARNERLVAIEALRTQLDAGRPLGTALPRLGAEVPPALARFATASPPTEPALRLAFEEAMRNARGTATPEGALNRLSSLLTIRRGDEVVWGDASEATVEQARRALDAGDLDGALAQLGRLPEPTRQAIRPWLNDAEALAAARAALRQLAGG